MPKTTPRTKKAKKAAMEAERTVPRYGEGWPSLQDLEATVERQRQEEEAARQREILAKAPRVRIFLKDGQVVECAILLPWLEWLRGVLNFHGVVFDHGWIPADLIKLIAPVNPDPAINLPENVLPFSRKT